MKKIHMIAALLAMLLPAVLFADPGSSKTYYAALKAQVSSSGGGKVYASTSSSTPSSSSFGSGNTAQNSGSSSSFTFYAHAQANEGYKFKNWTGDFSSTDNPYTASVTATSTSSSTYTTKTITANFEPLPPATVTFAAPANGSYTVNGESVSAQLVKSNQAVPYSVTLVATPASNFRFAGWYTLENGVKAFFSTDATTTKKFDVDVTVGAEFVPDGYAIYAAVAGKGYDDLTTALSEALPGESISVYSSTTLGATAAVDAGVSLTVASGVTLTVASGATLYIDGSVTANGAISGTVSKCTKIIQQTGDGTVNAETGKPNPFNPYDGVKYWRTTTTTPSISVSSSASHITVVNGYGNVFRTSATTANALVCMVDMSTAVNHITSIDTDYTSFKLAYESARQSATAGSGTSQNISGNSKLIVMLADDTSASESGEQRYGFMVDCAGCNLAFSATLKSNYDVVILNCPYTAGNQLKSTVTNTRVHFFNCTKAGVKINSKNSTIVNCYDCGDLSISYDPSTVQSGEVNIYSGGPYSASFNKLWHIYGGTFKSKPSTDYLWDSTNYEIQPEGSNWKVVEKKPTVYVAYTVTGTTTTEYESLSEAIGAVVNGGTVFLMQDIELEADLQIGAGREVTIEMTGCDISGHNIVNAGILHLEDRKMTSNPGTVSSGIVNNGTITIAYGEYAGSIQLNAGMFTVYNGTVDGSITVASSVEDPATVANLKGGQFTSRSFTHGSETKDISTICEAVESEHVVRAKNGRFRVARFPAAIVTDDTGTMAFSAKALNNDDTDLWTRFAASPTRSNFTSAEWYRACELQSTLDYYQTRGIDCAVLVDRLVLANSLSLTAPLIGTQPINEDISVSSFGFSALLPKVRDYHYAPWAYSTFLPGGEHSSISINFSNNEAVNNGTLFIAQMRLASDIQSSSGKKDYSYTQYEVIGSRKYVLGAGSNKAMIRPATGAATFYATLGAAMDAVADGGTVMLANDCDTALTLNKAGTYTFDTMGFAYSGGEPAVGSGLRIASVSTNTTESSAKVLVPDAMTITYVVENAGTIECGETKYVSIEAAVEASSDDTIAVTVTADDTETVTLPQGKTLTVTVNDGVEADVTVDPGAGAFIETTTSGSTTTYESKQITVEMEEPSAVEVVKVDHGVTNEVSDATLVNEAVHALTGNHDVSRTDNTDKLDVLDKITVTPAKIVEEVVGDKTIIRSVTFDVVPHLNAGQTLGEGQTLKFRLPVDAAATQLASIVYHVGEQFGVYPVQTYANEKFIEVTSADFSAYGYELLDGETANPIAAIGTTGYATLDAAVAAARNGDTVRLLTDATLGVESIATDITLDTAGHDMTIAGPNYLYIDGNVVFTNSAYNAADPTASGVVSVSTYGVCPYTGGSLTIANGRYEQTIATRHLFYTMGGSLVINDGSFDAPNCVVNTYVRNDGKTNGFGGTVTINGGDFHVGATSPQTIVRVNQGATVAINGGTFDADGGYVLISATVEGNSAAPASVAVNGGTFADGAIVSFNDTSIAVADGTFSQIELAACDDSSIAIGDGIFTQTELAAWDDASFAVSGGLFDSMVPEELCADGCIPSTETTNIEGVEYYTVKQGAFVARNVDTGVGYETLDSAVSAATAGDTITLLADIVDYVGTALVNKSLTINGAGHSITAAAVPEGGHRDMVHAFTGGTSMLKIGGGAVTVTNITFDGHATHAYTYLIQVVNSGASLTVGDISLLNGGELDNSGTPGAGYGAGIHVNNASLVVKDGFYACTGGAEYGVFPFTGILPEGNASVMFDLVNDSDNTPTVDIDDDLLLVGMIGAIDPDTAQAILDYMQVPSRFIPYTLTLGDGSDYAFTGASPRTWNDIIDYGKEIMDVSTSLGYEGLDKESTPVEVGLLTDTELPGAFVFEDANFTVNGNGHELTGTIKYTASAGELKNVVLSSDTILDISAEGAAVNFGDNVTIKTGEAVTLVVGDLSSGQTLATHVDGLSLDSVALKTWDGDNLVDAEIPEGLVLIEVDGNLVIAAAYEITWVSEGEILAVDVVISNTVPVYTGETPVKDADDNGIYTFKGWKPKLEAAVSNTTYTANFSNSCTIRWMTGDTIVKSVSVTNGTPAAEIAALAPSGASSPDGNARFAGWSPSVYADALGDADYIAQFEALDTLAGIVPGTLRFTSIKTNGRKVAVTFEFKPTGGETDAYRLIYKTALDSAETFVSDIANVTVIGGDENSVTAIAEVLLPEDCETRGFVTGLDFVEFE